MTTALTLPPIAKDADFSDTLTTRLVDFMYGSPERTWMTLIVAFTLLLVGVNMMDTSGTGAVCSL